MKQHLMKIGQTVLPLLIIAGLLYIALFVKPKPADTRVNVPAIEQRDRFYGIALPASSIVWAVANHGKVVRSEDRGDTWVVQKTPTIEHMQSISAWDDQRAVVVGNAGITLVTSDGGKNWKETVSPKHEVANKLLNVRTYSGGEAWAVGEFGAVLHSKDYGMTWERAREAEDMGINDIFFIGDKGWMACEFAAIFYTEDGGKTWERAETDMMEETTLLSVAFRDKLNGIIVGLMGTVLISNDGGKTWTTKEPPTIEHLLDVIWDRENSAWVAVGDNGIMYKGDSTGSTWNGGRMDDMVLSWYAECQKIGDRLYVLGSTFGYYENGKLTLFN